MAHFATTLAVFLFFLFFLVENWTYIYIVLSFGGLQLHNTIQYRSTK